MNKTNQQHTQDRVIREGECRQLTGVCRTTRYMMEREGRFPARRQLGGRSIGWVLSEVVEWLNQQPKATLGTKARNEGA